MAAGPTFEPIATTTTSTTTTSISFTSIPSSYTDLCVVFSNFGITQGGSAGRLRFNSDTGSNYSNTVVVGTGGNPITGRETNTTSIRIMGSQIGPATNETYWIHIPQYKNTSWYKGVFVRTGSIQDNHVLTGLWRSTSAITSMSFITYNGTDTFVAGVTATLYGIAAA